MWLQFVDEFVVVATAVAAVGITLTAKQLVVVVLVADVVVDAAAAGVAVVVPTQFAAIVLELQLLLTSILLSTIISFLTRSPIPLLACPSAPFVVISMVALLVPPFVRCGWLSEVLRQVSVVVLAEPFWLIGSLT